MREIESIGWWMENLYGFRIEDAAIDPLQIMNGCRTFDKVELFRAAIEWGNKWGLIRID